MNMLMAIVAHLLMPCRPADGSYRAVYEPEAVDERCSLLMDGVGILLQAVLV